MMTILRTTGEVAYGLGRLAVGYVLFCAAVAAVAAPILGLAYVLVP